MSDRYVNYDKLLEERHRLGLDEMSKISKVNAFNQFIDNLPIADIVEVVRCKDCDVPHNKWTGCPYLNGLIPPPDFYCARGERKIKESEKIK